jgi:hypothetical protein
LVSVDCGRVRVLRVGERWPEEQAKVVLRDG